MVAVNSGHEARQRERMVKLAATRGWVQVAATGACDSGDCATPVVVLACEDARHYGALGEWLAGSIGGLVEESAALHKIQNASGCPPFAVFTLPLSLVCDYVSNYTAEVLRTVPRTAHPVLCINATGVSVAGLPREATA